MGGSFNLSWSNTGQENESPIRNVFILLTIGIAAQVFIAAGIGIYLFRRHLREREEKKMAIGDKEHPPS